MRKTLELITIIVILYSTYLLVKLTLPYLALRPGVDFLISKQFIYRVDVWRISFYIHVFSSSILVVAGLTQFSKYLIHNKKNIHRIAGFIYLTVLLILSGPSGFIMALYANGGILAQIGFSMLSVLWISFTLLAYLNIREKKYYLHGKMMVYSYSLTLSAITLRAYSFGINYFNIDVHPVNAYIWLSYLSWIPNLIMAYILIKLGFVKRLLSLS